MTFEEEAKRSTEFYEYDIICNELYKLNIIMFSLCYLEYGSEIDIRIKRSILRLTPNL